MYKIQLLLYIFEIYILWIEYYNFLKLKVCNIKRSNTIFIYIIIIYSIIDQTFHRTYICLFKNRKNRKKKTSINLYISKYNKYSYINIYLILYKVY